MAASVIEIHRPRIHRIVDLTLRAACELLGDGAPTISSTSVTVELRDEEGAALELLRRAESLGVEFGLQVILEVQGRRATVRVSRGTRTAADDARESAPHGPHP